MLVLWLGTQAIPKPHCLLLATSLPFKGPQPPLGMTPHPSGPLAGAEALPLLGAGLGDSIQGPVLEGLSGGKGHCGSLRQVGKRV